MRRPAFNTNDGDELEIGLRASVASNGGPTRGRIGSAPLGFPVAAALASIERVGIGTALAMLEVKKAACRFVSPDAAREITRTVAMSMMLEPGADVAELALSNLRRLQQPSIRAGAPTVEPEADIEGCAAAMAAAWRGAPGQERDERIGTTWGSEASKAASWEVK